MQYCLVFGCVFVLQVLIQNNYRYRDSDVASSRPTLVKRRRDGVDSEAAQDLLHQQLPSDSARSVVDRRYRAGPDDRLQVVRLPTQRLRRSMHAS